jgi:hypothetical protein
VASLQEIPEFMGAQTLPDQYWSACQLFPESHILTVLSSFSGMIRTIEKGTVKYHYRRYETVGPLAERGDRPPRFTEEHREELVQRIAEPYQRRTPWTIGEIL